MRRFPDWSTLASNIKRAWRESALERARRLEPRLNAFVCFEEEIASVQDATALAGCPYAAKDIFAARSHRPSCGAAAPIDLDLGEQADVLSRLDQAGACRIGFTALTELAYQPSGYNSVHGCTRNPWQLDTIAGGSSSGSAAAVASGSVVIALGSDTGGSLRIPAHCCGVTAWKPSRGVVSSDGAMPLAPSLDVIGVMARSADDLASSVDVLARDGAAESPVRSAVILADVLEACEPAIRSACQQACSALEAAGVALGRAAGLAAIGTIDAHALTIMQAEAARVHRARIDDPTLDPTLRKRLAKGLAIDDPTLAASLAAQAPLTRDFYDRVLGKADAALLPVLPFVTPAAAETDPTSPFFRPRVLYGLSRFTRFVNVLGAPAVAIPAGFDARGLPIALQIVGRTGRDRALIALARRVQAKSDWHGRVPHDVADVVDDMEGLAREQAH
jgi:aspartyl-tRNA(Asn)/glutamyl-tRNA(Gln) amidotransferase subunit A